MKKIALLCLLLLFFVNSQSQGYDKNCFYGISFDISENPNWGYGELVITAVEPYSPAEKAGIKVGDIIMEINGKATYLRDNQVIADLLFSGYNPTTKFTIRNMDTYFKEYELERKCINYNSVNEQQLSELFAEYSINDTSTRSFVLPLRVTPTPDADFADYHTYDFSTEKGGNQAINDNVNDLLEKALQAKGLVRDTEDPDIVVQTYYIRIPNLAFTGLNDNPSLAPKTWRYDVANKKMVALPIFDGRNKKAVSDAQYIMEFGFTLYDRKYLKEGELVQIWDCNLRDYLSSRYAVEDYVRFHTPLMLMQFPFSTKKQEATYTVSFNEYNYTGIYFDDENILLVKDIDENSPAYKAGIRVGYTIKSINNKPLLKTKKEQVLEYDDFIYETADLRNPDLVFTDAGGTKQMPWNEFYKKDIQKVFGKKSSQTSFAYLYDFNDFVSSTQSNIVKIEAWDGKQIRRFVVLPERRKSITIKAF